MASNDSVSFYLNGKAVTIEKPPPDLLLIDYLRSPEVALAGPKKPCGEGGCGGCTVILSSWNETLQKPEHRAINACLRPVCALSGLVITTVEGTGAVRKPDPQFLLHTLTASRTAAPLDTQYSPVLQQAAEAAATKRAAVLAAVSQARRCAAGRTRPCGAAAGRQRRRARWGANTRGLGCRRASCGGDTWGHEPGRIPGRAAHAGMDAGERPAERHVGA